LNGAHDLGGMHGFGPVQVESGEPVFHHEWERRVFALTLASGMLGAWNIDESRLARERMPPGEYLATTYFEHWLFGLEALLDDRGFATRAELAARIADPGSPAAPVDGVRAVGPADAAASLRRSRLAKLDDDVPARFRVGDAIVTRTINPAGHTRLPRYARGRRGVVTLDHGVWVFPDASGDGLGRQPQHCYTVRFEARELWGDEAPHSDAVYIDLWDDHLESR
jgi:nitrile hydratase subunit beta